MTTTFDIPTPPRPDLRSATAEQLVLALATYDFRDPNGHQLINCGAFQELARRAERCPVHPVSTVSPEARSRACFPDAALRDSLIAELVAVMRAVESRDTWEAPSLTVIAALTVYGSSFAQAWRDGHVA